MTREAYKFWVVGSLKRFALYVAIGIFGTLAMMTLKVVEHRVQHADPIAKVDGK